MPRQAIRDHHAENGAHNAGNVTITSAIKAAHLIPARWVVEIGAGSDEAIKQTLQARGILASCMSTVTPGMFSKAAHSGEIEMVSLRPHCWLRSAPLPPL